MEKNFNYNSLPVRTVTDGEDQTWFAGIDVCNILEYQNSSDILDKKLDDDEKKLEYLTDSSGQRRKTWTINESGLYSLILSSSKQEAKAFKRWVTHEVLPAIRKAGRFTTEDEKEYELTLQKMANNINEMRDEKETMQKKVNEIRKNIDIETAKMIAFIKCDRRQLKIPFNYE